jgi:hypothetical protein
MSPEPLHPHDEKRAEDHRIIRRHRLKCTDPECCSEEEKRYERERTDW